MNPESARTIFKPVGLDDVTFLEAFYSDDSNTSYIPAPSGPIERLVRDRMLHWSKHGFGTFIVYLKSNGEKIGYCGIEYIGDSSDADIRYGLVNDQWGKGLGTEVANLGLNIGFNEFGLTKIWGAAEPENLASIRILEELGMTPDPEFNHYGDVVTGFSIVR